MTNLTSEKESLISTILALREKLGLSRAEFCRIYNIPVRTVEAWDSGVRICSHWSASLLVSDLERRLSTHYDEVFAKYEKIATELGPDVDGNLAEVRWCAITDTRHDQFFDFFSTAAEAVEYVESEYLMDRHNKIKTYGPGKRSIYAACALFTKGTNDMFETADGEIYSNHDDIK